ncbi:MAG: hypothetical protein PHR30_02930 [Gallionellaceae bacterium]|nr:hypothetical protein [Gallionellaceae bacterium]MDD5364271.1 hypothetical protein [Gallionellaceae bacterium]
MHAEQEMQQIKGRIAEVYARREQLKQALDSGRLAPRAGFPQLDATDQELSALDSRYKTLWDAAHPRPAAHPAAGWARQTVFTSVQLDCVTAIMLKILDAKCKMDAADQAAISAVYDVVRDRPGQGLGAEVHGHIESARRGGDAELAAVIHDWRVRVEAQIAKPAMKAFKQLLRASMPR